MLFLALSSILYAQSLVGKWVPTMQILLERQLNIVLNADGTYSFGANLDGTYAENRGTYYYDNEKIYFHLLTVDLEVNVKPGDDCIYGYCFTGKNTILLYFNRTIIVEMRRL